MGRTFLSMERCQLQRSESTGGLCLLRRRPRVLRMGSCGAHAGRWSINVPSERPAVGLRRIRDGFSASESVFMVKPYDNCAPRSDLASGDRQDGRADEYMGTVGHG